MIKQPCVLSRSSAGEREDYESASETESESIRTGYGFVSRSSIGHSHAHRVIPLVHINGGAGDTARERAGEECGRVADLFRGQRIRQRRILRRSSRPSAR